MRMLPISVVVRSADEVSAHAMASSRGHLDVSQTTCVTVACFEMDVADESRLHALATGMTGLYHIRLACASRLSGQFVQWPGRHMVVDNFDCGEHREVPLDWPDRDLFDILDASPGLVHLSLLKNIDLPYDGSVDLGVAFSARAETVRCGAVDEPFYFSRGALLCERGPSHMARLRSLHFFERSFEDGSSAVVGHQLDNDVVAPCPALRSVLMAFMDFPWQPERDLTTEREEAAALLNRLPATCPLLICELVDESGNAALASRLADVLASAVTAAVRISIDTLAVDVRECGVADAWRSSIEVTALASSCAARGVALRLVA